MNTGDFQKGIAVFAGGFSFTRSFTHPYPVERLEERVVVLRDAPRSRGDYRTEEFIASGLPVSELLSLVEKAARGRFRICYLLPEGEADSDLRKQFKERGYRLMTTEELFIHRLGGVDKVNPPFPIVPVSSEAQAALLAKVSGRRQILPEHLRADRPLIRFYMAMNEDAPIGWVGTVIVGEATWCTSMYVAPAYRRQGVARSLLARMLADDREAGMTGNFLLASHAGSRLYPTVGYTSLGTLYMFTPPRSKEGVASA